MKPSQGFTKNQHLIRSTATYKAYNITRLNIHKLLEYYLDINQSTKTHTLKTPYRFKVQQSYEWQLLHLKLNTHILPQTHHLTWTYNPKVKQSRESSL